jgi:hypothetical protein
MMVRAKLHLTSVLVMEGGRRRVTFETRYDTSIPEDRRFQKATPTGHMVLDVDNPAVFDFLQPGTDYYLDLSGAPPLPSPSA